MTVLGAGGTPAYSLQSDVSIVRSRCWRCRPSRNLVTFMGPPVPGSRTGQAFGYGIGQSTSPSRAPPRNRIAVSAAYRSVEVDQQLSGLMCLAQDGDARAYETLLL